MCAVLLALPQAAKKVEKATATKQFGIEHGYEFADEPYQNTPHYGEQGCKTSY